MADLSTLTKRFSKVMLLTQKRKVDTGLQKQLNTLILSLCIWLKISGIDTHILLLFAKLMKVKTV